MDTVGFLSYIVKTATNAGVENVRGRAQTEVKKAGEVLRTSVEEGITNAVSLSMPIVRKNGYFLIGGAFLLFGIARLIDVIVKYDGTGFVVVGIISLLIGLLINTNKK